METLNRQYAIVVGFLNKIFIRNIHKACAFCDTQICYKEFNCMLVVRERTLIGDNGSHPIKST